MNEPILDRLEHMYRSDRENRLKSDTLIAIIKKNE